MKTITKTIILLSFLIISSATLPTNSSAQNVAVSFQLFYDNLSPYGQWIDDPEFGYAWIPNVDYDFTPYSTDGHWAYTVYGWTWVSYYDWGWAPFHYGRWGYNDSYGWYWVPGNEWGPSWVVWRRAEGYYGWAPMGPGINISVTFGSDYHIPHHCWTFVRERDIYHDHIHKYHIDRSRNVTIINQTIIINNKYEDHHRHVTYVYGPNRDEVQRVTGRSVRSYAIYDYDKPGTNVRGSKIRIYRPEVERGQASGHRPAPTRVINSRDYRRPSGSGTNEQRTYNAQDNRRERQQRTESQPNNNNERSVNQRTDRSQRNQPNNETQRSTQRRSVDQPENNSRERQQRTESRPNNNVERSTQQQNTNQSDNTRTERQSRVNESSGSRQQSTQQNVNRSENTGTERQTRTVNRPSTENQRSTQQRNTNQSNVNREERQTNQSSSGVQRSSQQNNQSDNKSEQRQSRSAKETEKRTESTSRGRR